MKILLAKNKVKFSHTLRLQATFLLITSLFFSKPLLSQSNSTVRDSVSFAKLINRIYEPNSSNLISKIFLNGSRLDSLFDKNSWRAQLPYDSIKTITILQRPTFSLQKFYPRYDDGSETYLYIETFKSAQDSIQPSWGVRNGK